MVSENVIILTREESIEVQREEVRRVYNMSLEEYRSARAAGTLPRVPNATRDEVEMMLGDGLSSCGEWEELDEGCGAGSVPPSHSLGEAVMVREGVWDLTREESIEVQRERVHQVYKMSLEEYRSARALGILPRVPNAARDYVEMLLFDNLVSSPEWRELDED